MGVNKSDMQSAVLTGFRKLFDKEFLAATNATGYLKISTLFNSTGDSESYNWLGTVPQMREWKGDREISGLLGNLDYDIKNRKYESTIQVDKDTLDDDKLGMITPRIRQLGLEAARHPDQIIMELLANGATGLAYDGIEFYDSTRVIGKSANIDNLLAITGVTEANIRTDIGLANLAMREFQDDQGRPMNIQGDTIVCGPATEMIIEQALTPGVSGTVRPEAKRVKQIIVTPYITDNSWHWLSTKQITRPFLWQWRKKPMVTALTKPDSEYVFLNNKYLYGVDYRGAGGYGDPRYAVKIAA